MESSLEDFYCPDSGGTDKSTGKIQLSIICSDLIAMVTEQWEILIRPALATRRNGMVVREGRQKVVTEGEGIMTQLLYILFLSILTSKVATVHV